MKTRTLFGCWALATLCAVSSFAQSVDTVLSTGLGEPNGLVLDGSSSLYITDQANNRVLKYVPATGILTVIAGSTAAAGEAGFTSSTVGADARFNSPQGLVLARGGLVVADSFNHTIRFVGFNGTVTNIAGTNVLAARTDGVGTAARFLYPVALSVGAGGTIYIADFGNNAIRKLEPNDTVSTIITGLNQPTAVAVGDGADLWVADRSNRIFLYNTNGVLQGVTIGTGVVGTNDSVAANATFNHPSALLWMGAGAGLLVSDANNHSIRRVFTNTTQNTYNVITVAGVPGQSGLVNGATNLAKFNQPMGLVNDALNGAFLVADTKNSAIRQIQQSTPLPTVGDPVIGTVELVSGQFGITAVMTPVVSGVFNNDVVIAVKAGEQGTETLYTFGESPTNAFLDTIPDPGPGSPTAPFYQDGGSALPPTLVATVKPDLTIKAIGSQSGRRPSAVVKARFQFKTASPSFVGDNAASFTFSNATVGAEMYYTTDGSDPTNSPSSSVAGPVPAGQKISLNMGTTNILVKVRAFRSNYQPSEIASNSFSPTDFSANKISFGFSSGVGSSDFVGSAGQTFAAPVTLTLLPGESMYSLQFSLSVTNGTALTSVTAGAIGFDSRLYRPLPDTTYVVIPPARSLGDASGTFTNLLATNSALNLLGVGWLETFGKTNLYNTVIHPLTKHSFAHDTYFDGANGKVVVGNFYFRIPPAATAGETYTIRIGRPSATSDGVREDVFIEAPTNGALTAASPINAIKTVTVGTRKYLVGDVAPFRWYNAGDYGDTNLLNNDVLQVFTASVYGLNRPPAGTDFFDAMDSCNGTVGVQSGDNTTINAITLGDTALNVDDVFVTFRRSLDGTLSNYFRYWSGGVRVAELYTGSVYQRGAGRVAKKTAATQTLVAVNNSTEPPAVSFVAGDVVGGAGQTLQVPITARIAGAYPIRVLMMNLTVRALDGAPEITDPVQFTPAPVLGQPTYQDSRGPNNYAAVWLDDAVAGLTGTNDVGVLQIKLPANASANAAYAVVFDHVSASPNGLRLFRQQLRTGLVTLADRSASSMGDALPDSWRLRYFGSVSNLLAQASADADGDGIPNLAEFKAGTNPNDAASKLQMRAPQAPGTGGQAQGFVVRWASVSGKQYVVERSTELFGGTWNAVSPTLSGSGWDMEYRDTGVGAGARFYRVRVLE